MFEDDFYNDDFCAHDHDCYHNGNSNGRDWGDIFTALFLFHMFFGSGASRAGDITLRGLLSALLFVLAVVFLLLYCTAL